MKNSSLGLLFVIFIIISTTVCVLGLTKQFHLVQIKKTWQQARDHCRSHYTDLGTIRSQEEADHLLPYVLAVGSPSVWLGLYRTAADRTVWRWTELDHAPLVNASEYTNWALHHQPEDRKCARINLKSKLWFSVPCTGLKYFICNDGSTIRLVKKKMAWEKAQQHCEKKYQGLATITAKNIRDVGTIYNVWIGLIRDVDDVWKWVGKTQSAFRNWARGHPVIEDCAKLNDNAVPPSTNSMLWYSSKCHEKHFFLCYEENLILVKQNKTWEEALEICRTLAVDPALYPNHRYDLASLLSDEDHLYAREKILATQTDEVWTGLRFLAGQWLWVNGDELGYQHLPRCPARWQHCGSLPKDGARPWEVRDCRDRRNFLCFKRK